MKEGPLTTVRSPQSVAALAYLVSLGIVLLLGSRLFGQCAACHIGLPASVLGSGSMAWAIVGYLWLCGRTGLATAVSIGLTLLHSILALSISAPACIPCLVILAIEASFVIAAGSCGMAAVPARIRRVIRAGTLGAGGLSLVSAGTLGYGLLALSSSRIEVLSLALPKEDLPAFLLAVKGDCGSCPRNFVDLERTVHSRLRDLRSFNVVNVEEAAGRELARALGIQSLPAFAVVARDYTVKMQQGTTLAGFLHHVAGGHEATPSSGPMKNARIQTESAIGKVLGKDPDRMAAVAILAGAGTSTELADLILLGESPLTRWAALRACRGRTPDLKMKRAVRISAAYEDDPWIRTLASDLYMSFPVTAGN